MTTSELANFLGWCTLLNFALLIVATMAIVMARQPIAAIHGRMMGLDANDLSKAYFSYVANYKLLIVFFNLVPYLALRIMGS